MEREAEGHGLSPADAVAEQAADDGAGDVEAIDQRAPAHVLDERGAYVEASEDGGSEYAEGIGDVVVALGGLSLCV